MLSDDHEKRNEHQANRLFASTIMVKATGTALLDHTRGPSNPSIRSIQQPTVALNGLQTGYRDHGLSLILLPNTGIQN